MKLRLESELLQVFGGSLDVRMRLAGHVCGTSEWVTTALPVRRRSKMKNVQVCSHRGPGESDSRSADVATGELRVRVALV